MVRPGPARQASLRRMSRFNIKPVRRLGQNFLIDDNILGVIGRESELNPDDVILEVGGGLGVLSEYLAARAGFVHVLEIDRRLEPALREAVAGAENVNLVFGDAASIEIDALSPAPNKMVANLPYQIAVPVLIRSTIELPGMELWCVMLQRELANRLAAQSGSKEYGSVTVQLGLCADVEIRRAISRTVFAPSPRVDSALVLIKRRCPAAAEHVRLFVDAAFSHRRKALPKSVALAAESDPLLVETFQKGATDLREAVKSALSRLGLPQDIRAEGLSPAQFAELANMLM